MYDKQGMNN